MATHSSALAWKIPWTEEPGGLPSTGPRGVPHSCAHTLPVPLSRSILSFKVPSRDPQLLLQCVCSVLSDSATPWTGALQALRSMGFSRQEHWSELPFPSPGDLPNPEIELMSLASLALAGGFFTDCTPWKP